MKREIIKAKEEKEEYILEDKDFLLIEAINRLASAIEVLRR
jgi:hypothetical protein